MDLYTLSPTFIAKDNIDEFVSAIWTERYSAMGDFQLVLPLTVDNLSKTLPGTFLALRGTHEVMECQTQSIENGLLTVVGTSLLGFLNQRQAWFRNKEADSDTPKTDLIADYTDKEATAGGIISHVVDLMVINPDPEPWLGYIWEPVQLLWDDEVIPGLELGAIDTTGTPERITVTIGPLYDAIAQVAQKYKVGISLYLESADAVEGYVLKFKTYRGVDRSIGDDKIRLSPQLESMSDVKEVRSNAYLKNVCYVYWKGNVHDQVFYADPLLPIPTGMDRRVLITNPDKEPVGHKVTIHSGYQYGGPGTYDVVVTDEEDIAKFLAQNAKDALANANYINAVDGQTSPDIEQKFGVDYGLGDIIELEGLTGIISKARITEYIRAQDETGEREYPTISVETPDGGE